MHRFVYRTGECGRCGSSGKAILGRRAMKQVTAGTTLVSPFRCRMWSLHDRLEEHITEESCKAEIESFQSHGQVVPVIGRPVPEDPGYDFELIFGARRL